MIPYSRQSINFFDVLSVSKQLAFKSLTQGEKIEEFEAKIAEYVGAKYAVSVSSATAGLHLAVIALGLPLDSEIITSPISFVASSNVILNSGHRPKFVDIERDTINVDVSLIAEEINSNRNVRAVIPVHFAGLPCNMRKLSEVLASKEVKVIEDAAHAFGATYPSGAKVGSCENSDMTVFSFHPVKSITTGEGGVITTNSIELYRKLLRLRSHGINKLDDSFESHLLSSTYGMTNPWYYEMQDLGYNYRLTEIQAALGLSQLKRINSFIRQRSDKAKLYRQYFSNSKFVRPAQTVDNQSSAHHIFPVRINFTSTSTSRAKLMNSLKSQGIGSQVHYIPIPMHPYYQALGYKMDNLAESLSYYMESLSLPLYPKLTKIQQKKVIKAINSFF